MSLPEITAPIGTPVFLEAGHAITPRSVYANVEMITGYARKRRVYTVAPRIQSVAWFLNSAQMAAVDEWFEETLDVGNRRFAALVASDRGPGRLWWTAQWVAPYRAEPLNLGMWRVTGDLLLIGDGSVEGPVATSAGLEIVVALTSTASATIDGHAAMEIQVALLPLILARLEMSAALLSFTPDFLLREDSGYILREDGGRIQRE